MTVGVGEIIEMRSEAGGVGAVITLPAGMLPAAGQYLLAAAVDSPELLPEPLFPAGLPARQMRFAPPLPAGWLPGVRLALRGPLGFGFDLPQHAPQVALAALGHTAAALLPLVQLALSRGAAVALYAADLPPGLPAEVELLPLDLLPEAPAWADYLAVDLPLARLPDLPALLGLRSGGRFPRAGQALVRVPMPCTALAECGVCALHTHRGWRLACKDGPVFALSDLIDS